MITPNFRILNNLSSQVNARDSEIAWREFLVAVSYFTNHCSYRIKEDHIGEITKSLQNWVTKRNHTEFFKNRQRQIIDLGDILLADLGLSYETAYAHPVVVLEFIGNKLLVVPVTSSIDKVNDAYHPAENPTGNRMFMKVFPRNGFEVESALMLNSVSVISKGRILDKKGMLNEDINQDNSLFNEIKTLLMEIYFGKFYYEYEAIKKENEELKKRLSEYEKQIQDN